jgi:hypothetical protein
MNEFERHTVPYVGYRGACRLKNTPLTDASTCTKNYATATYGDHVVQTRFVSSFSSISLTRSVILLANSGSSHTALSVSTGVKTASLASKVWHTPGAVRAAVSLPSDSGGQVNCCCGQLDAE